MKPQPTQAALLLRAKLAALVSRGIDGEAENAKRKLARLDARYDFTAPCEQQKGDIFAGLQFNIRSQTARELATFAQTDSDIASFVQWAISTAAGVNGSLRQTADWKLSVWMEADASAIPRLTVIAETIRRSFADLWKSFAGTPGVRPEARKSFLLGLYDGMMIESRATGQCLPPVVAAKVKVSKRKRQLAAAPGISIHPYEIALGLGRDIRLSVPLGQIVETLEGRIEALAA